jgi:hypothetical protein
MCFRSAPRSKRKRAHVLLLRWWRAMSDLERLLVRDCTDLPACRCGKEMHIDHTHLMPERADTHIRVYRCLACHHEMRLTVWGVDPATVSHTSENGREQSRR